MTRPAPLKRLRMKVLGRLHRFIDRGFDVRHGTETQANVHISELETDLDFSAYLEDELYVGTPSLLFRALHTPVFGLMGQHTTYVDVGCGKARMLIKAIEAGFTRVRGVEFVPSLAEMGRANIKTALNGQCMDWRIDEDDARTYSYPEGDIVLFLYNPFDPEVFKPFLENLIAHCKNNPGALTIIYNNCLCSDLLDNAPQFQRISYPLGARVFLSALNPHPFGMWKYVPAASS